MQENTEILDLDAQFSELLSKRSGEFEVNVTYNELKYIKNTLAQKIEWTGSNEAYLLVLTLVALDSRLEELNPKLQEKVKISLPSVALETINYFFSKISGKGVDAAQKLFAAAMQIRPAIEEMKKLDSDIQRLKSEIDASKISKND